jgi:hypothetical protein
MRLCLPCGTRFIAPAGGRTAVNARERARRTPERVREQTRRGYLRRLARDEARESKRPVEQVYAEWGVA